MTEMQNNAIAAIAAQQPKERSAIWMVGEQLKDMIRAEPGIAACRHRTEPKCNKADYAARGIAKCGNHSAPAYGRLVYLTDFCNYGSGGMG